MKRSKISIIFLLIGSLLILPFAMGAGPKMERKIVVYKSGTAPEKRIEVLKKHGGVKVDELNIINAQSVLLPVGKATALANDPEVRLVEDDAIVTIQAQKGATVTPPVEVLPWGIDQIDADLTWDVTTGASIKVAVVDTGIDTDHPDLYLNVKGGYSCVSYTTSYKDDNGHGSHVAGIIGATDNQIGVIGVGPNIDLYAVKVLDRKGNGNISNIIKGLEWCIGNHMQVVNMSLGSSLFSQALADAVEEVYLANIVQVAAAGNNGGAVCYPAALDKVIAVGATDNTDKLAYFSSRGSEVDIVAPGVSIYSTYKGSTYVTLNGTSMASPHVAGAAALVIASGKATTPDSVKNRLEATATDLGEVGRDIYYGSGLVNVSAAVKN